MIHLAPLAAQIIYVAHTIASCAICFMFIIFGAKFKICTLNNHTIIGNKHNRTVRMNYVALLQAIQLHSYTLSGACPSHGHNVNNFHFISLLCSVFLLFGRFPLTYFTLFTPLYESGAKLRSQLQLLLLPSLFVLFL